MHLSVIDALDRIAPTAWDNLTGRVNPFLRHTFLVALERTGCITPATGWTPQHLAVFSEQGGHGTLLGAAPMYIKHHSYGEFVFDWAWAQAYARIGLRYYPKLVATVPFTPATGPRLLLAPGAPPEVQSLLIDGARELAQDQDASSVHWLFAPERELRALEDRRYLRRVGYQFHWNNRVAAEAADGEELLDAPIQRYESFEHFLSGFSSEKRKKIKRERRYVREAGIEMEMLTGSAITLNHWQAFYDFYHATTAKHGASAYLTREFFFEIGRTMADDVVLVLARHGDRYVAGALNFRGHDALYGRYWGSTGEFHSLHFETCYYRAIEYCIDQGVARFEAGAQGEHKLARGFLPTPVYSAHWLAHAQLRDAIADFLRREQNGVGYYINELNEHSPFKKECG